MTAEVAFPDVARLTRDLDEISGLVDTSRPGWSRVAMTEVDTDSRHWVAERMRAAGLEVRIDGIGNVIGTLAGTGAARRAIVIGSHTDTVDGGGRYDGIVGVMGAIEVARLLQESGIRLHHDLRVVDFYNEEANRFELSCLGSRALAGSLTAEHLSATDETGRTLGAALEAAGWADPLTGTRWSSDDVLGFLELHIEQGPILEREGLPLGVVTSIAGISRFRTLFTGRRDHAGTMPMSLRHDAGCAAAGVVLAVERIASTAAQAVGTVGSVTFTPEATSVITESALVTAEFRSPDLDWFTLAREEIAEITAIEAGKRGLRHEVTWLPWERPTAIDPRLAGSIGRSIDRLGHPAAQLYSGAGHDGVQMARLGPIGMIFIPSRDGRSHCPEEFTETTDIALGVHALAQSVVTLDKEGLA
ncbi:MULTISPECIES: M20 family metallo-hydrolase [unclassified Rathayibacter]|uniref:M20 family metallo-hydrolase n=1 Tax=unclassified Rathayibacter TaxID=2609250 RepID=UPI00104A7CF3|nr:MULTISPECIES: M20 family metallo-hydrolase [unclassified Rathayibacter]TCL82264.1 N-carbamoyl-L-amino-acid hydrolase [Rathayibacter sp. PhB192]TCM27480.1 N-carbamoyl-L-amino-acid hydrolase [Rathayibacter sp. PhB179]